MPLSEFTADDLPAFKRAITQRSHDEMDDIDMIFDIETRGEGVSKESRFTQMVRHFRSLTDTDAALLKAVNAVYTSRQSIEAWRMVEQLRQLESTVFKRVGVEHVEGKGYQFTQEAKPKTAERAVGGFKVPSTPSSAAVHHFTVSKQRNKAERAQPREDYEGLSAWEQADAAHMDSLRQDAERQAAEERAEHGSMAEWEWQAAAENEHAQREAERQDEEERNERAAMAFQEREAQTDAEDAHRESEARRKLNIATQPYRATQQRTKKESESDVATEAARQTARDNERRKGSSPRELAEQVGHEDSGEVTENSEKQRAKAAAGPSTKPERNKVFIIQGRDAAPVEELEKFIHFLGLKVLTFMEAKSLTGKATPATFEIVLTALEHAGAIIVLMSPDEEATLRPALGEGHVDSGYQPRQNVLLEAGLAYGVAPERTIIVRTDGPLRSISDIVGHHYVTMDGSWDQRQSLIDALHNAGLSPQPDSGNLLHHLAGAFKVDRP